MLSRRGFMTFLSVAAMTAITPLRFIAPVTHARSAEALSFAEIMSTTLRHHLPEIVANVTNSNPLYKRLKRNA